MKKELLANTMGLLARAGFYVSEICTIRPSSFDFVARRDNTLLMVKVLNNIDALSEDVAKELLLLAKYLDGIPVLIGNRTSSGPLEDETLYCRYKVPIMTYETLNDCLQGVMPIICAAPGGLYANMDGSKIKELREKKSISLGQLAWAAGVSRRTIRMYEMGERATIEVAEKIGAFLGEEILKPIDLMEFISNYELEIERNINDDMLSMIKSMGISILPTSRSPFNAISELVDELLLVSVNDRRIIERAHIISNVSKVVEKHSVFFIEYSSKKNIEGIPVIEKKELYRIDEPVGLLDLIRERE
ncbi:MAG: transcriptional regulator [Candidatus Thermoplasmatota archaeon]|nr:transcriptional regulator [Candidatus Thermoplasmatota archaeon]